MGGDFSAVQIIRTQQLHERAAASLAGSAREQMKGCIGLHHHEDVCPPLRRELKWTRISLAQSSTSSGVPKASRTEEIPTG